MKALIKTMRVEKKEVMDSRAIQEGKQIRLGYQLVISTEGKRETHIGSQAPGLCKQVRV